MAAACDVAAGDDREQFLVIRIAFAEIRVQIDSGHLIFTAFVVPLFRLDRFNHSAKNPVSCASLGQRFAGAPVLGAQFLEAPQTTSVELAGLDCLPHRTIGFGCMPTIGKTAIRCKLSDVAEYPLQRVTGASSHSTSTCD